MGLELGSLFRQLGSKVTLICGPEIKCPKDVRARSIVSAQDLLNAVKREFPKTDIFISAAAVSDWRPKKINKKKLSKGSQKLLLELVPNPDILARVAGDKKKQFCVGFALENFLDFRIAKKKMSEKNCNLMILNTISSMGGEWMKAAILFKNGEIWKLGRLKKKDCAKKICQAILISQ